MKSKLLLATIICAAVTAWAAPPKKSPAKTPAVKQETVEVTEPVHPLLDHVAPEKRNMARNMLERVEKVQLVDTLHVDSATFFLFYDLSRDVGELLNVDVLPLQLRNDDVKIVYRTQSGKELFWAETLDSMKVIVTSDVLDNGTVDTPRRLGEAFNDGGGNADYPFILQDGMTIYFANNGENSLGGYDIFMTRRSPEGEVLQPQNIGMPYNSPYNDYMMVIDETRNLGWWASDREQIPGKVTLYVFRPSEIRVNQNPDLNDIEDIALLNIAEYSHNLNDLLVSSDIKESVTPEFELYINGRLVTKLKDIRNPQARQAMKQVLDLQSESALIDKRLDVLRQKYASGDTSVARDITVLEKRKLTLPLDIQRLTNKVISLEK